MPVSHRRWRLLGHAFISYVREDSLLIGQLQRKLQAAGIPVWRDMADLWPGEDWRIKTAARSLTRRLCSSHASPTQPSHAARATRTRNSRLLSSSCDCAFQTTHGSFRAAQRVRNPRPRHRRWPNPHRDPSPFTGVERLISGERPPSGRIGPRAKALICRGQDRVQVHHAGEWM